MGKYDGILLCSDLDGTLLDSSSKLSKENYDAIKYFCDHGGKFCLATGRWPSYLLEIVSKDLFNCPIICCNGACIYDFETESVLYANPLGDKAEELCRFIIENCKGIVNSRIIENLNLHMFENMQKNAGEIISLMNSVVYKMVLITNTAEDAIEIRELLTKNFGDDFDFTRSWDKGVEILKKGATKGDAISHLKDIIKGVSTCICVGDYENDVTMIKNADIGCAMANAVPALKAAADKTICNNDEHAIKYIVENICDKL